MTRQGKQNIKFPSTSSDVPFMHSSLKILISEILYMCSLKNPVKTLFPNSFVAGEWDHFSWVDKEFNALTLK